MSHFLDGAGAVLKNRNFRLFLFFRFFMTVATIMLSVIVSWQIYALTKDVLLLGVIGLVEVIPQVGISLFAGYYVDKWDRRKIIRNTLIVIFTSVLILITYNITAFDCYAKFGILPIFITVFLSGLARGILMPANSAMMGELAPKDHLPRAAAINSATWQTAAVAGPAFGGLIYGFFGALVAYCTAGASLILALIFITMVKYERTSAPISEKESIFSSINTGIKFVLAHQIILGAFSLDMFAVLFGGAVAMLPVFAVEVLHVGAEGLGLLRASPAIGAIIMSIFLSLHPPVNKSGHKLLFCVLAFGVCMIVFALSQNFYLSLFVLLLSGLFDNMSVVIRGSILQMYTPNEMRGRVSAVNSIFIGSSNELGSFESGITAKIMGLIPSVIFGGAMTLIVVLIASIKAPKLRELELKDAI